MISETEKLGSLRLAIEVFVWRKGTVWVLIVLLLVAAGAMLLAHRLLLQPQLQARTLSLETLRSSLSTLQKTPHAVAEQSLEPSLITQSSLQKVMVARDALPEVIRSIHEVAQLHRIKVQSSDYQLKELRRGGMQQQIITLPMRVGYERFKPFLFDVLRNHPGVSIEQISIKRENVAQNTPEIVLRLSVWVLAEPVTDSGVRP